MLSVKLQGGLGNWLFQLAAGETIAKECNKQFFISNLVSHSVHSNINYFTNICKYWESLYDRNKSVVEFPEPSFNLQNWKDMLVPDSVTYCLVGYFQNYKYVSDDFISKLVFNTSIAEKYQKLEHSVFIHIRGTDYKNHWLHDVSLDKYYKKAINVFPKDTHFYIFTNDESYASNKSYLKDVSYTIIHENEIDSLYLMSQCKIGGICANSSFSWWGAFLNPNRKIIMPSKWYNSPNFYTDGYYFPGVIKISLSDEWDFIDKVIYINLNHRTDRNESMKEMTKCFEDKVIRFSAIQQEPGFIGCTKSHIAVLEMAIENKWKNVMILEDDAIWNKYEQGYDKLKKFINTAYDVIVLGGTFVNRIGDKVLSCKTTVGYVVNSNYYLTLLNNFKEGLSMLEQTHNKDLFAIDSYWSKLQQKDNWLIITPCLVYQKPDYSDICKVHQNYTTYFQLD